MPYGYIAELPEGVECEHVRFDNRYGIAIAGDRAHPRAFSEKAFEMAAEPKELFVVEDAEHIDLYDRVDRIPFDKLESFFKENL